MLKNEPAMVDKKEFGSNRVLYNFQGFNDVRELYLIIYSTCTHGLSLYYNKCWHSNLNQHFDEKTQLKKVCAAVLFSNSKFEEQQDNKLISP